jgi:hypothetical protein
MSSVSKTRAVRIVERERVSDAMRPMNGLRHLTDPAPNTPPVDQPIAAAIVGEQTLHRLIDHG